MNKDKDEETSTLTLTFSKKQKHELEKISISLGITWNGKSNISGLIRAIADHEIPIGDTAIREALKAISVAKKALAN